MFLKMNNREIRTDLSHFSLRDKVVTEGQMKGHNFAPELIHSVACRCRWGFPQVLCCRPIFKGRPFPTTFWLCCPYLSYKCGTLESMGAIAEFERYLGARTADYRIYNALYALNRMSMLGHAEKDFMQTYRPKLFSALRVNGIGGIRQGTKPTVKCLHLQTGTMLSLRSHPGEDWIREHLGDLSCVNAHCSCFLQTNEQGFL